MQCKSRYCPVSAEVISHCFPVSDRTPPEVAILGNRYHLSSDLTGVIDFDDEDDDFSSADDAPKPRINKLNEDVKDPKRRRRELPAQQRREAYEMESKADRTYVQRVRKSAMKDFKQKKSKLARGILTSLKRLRSCPRQPRVSSAKNGTSLVERTPAITDDSSDSDELEQESHSSDSASDGSDDEVTRKTVEKETISDSSDSDDDEGEEVVDSVFSSFPSVRKFAHKYLRKKSKVQRSRPTSVRRSSRSSTTASERTTTTKSQRSDDHEEKGGDAKVVNKAQAKEPKKVTLNATASCFQDYIDLTLEDDDDSFLDEVETRTKGSGSKQTSARHFFKPNGKSASIKLSEESLTAREIEIKRQAAINAFRYFPSANGLVINEKRPPEDEAITMVDQFAALLQPHQVEGIRFLWENTMKSITDARQPDSKETYGCVLAHCMGLGKTFTVIAFLATLMANPTIRGIVDPDPSLHAEDAGFSPERPKPLIHRVLVITPKNVLHNWAKEVYKWTPKELLPLLNITTVDGTNQSKADKHRKRLQQIHDWYVKGGILVMSYEMFRSLVIEDTRDTNISATDKQLRLEKAQKYLVDPGPDMVVADEAHIIKNDRTKINEAVSALRTKRRIALTGTPLQNHLDEYWCMVEWVKKRFLYSRKEFMKLFIRPIREGEAKDAPLSRVQNMKKRSHALHKRLTPIVHRKDQSELSKMISKREFIITVRMTGFQSYLYKLYLSKLKRSGTTFLFRCFQTMMRISNHPVNIALHAATWIQNDMNKAIRAHSGSSKLSLREAARQLTPIHDHYKNQGKEALQKLERAADRNEQGLLRESTKTSSKASRRGAKNAKKRKAKGKARRRLKKLEEQIARVDEDDILFDDDDDDDDDYFDEDDDGNSTQGDSSDDGYGEDNLDDDDGADLEDFVVDDDVIEYNSDESASDLLETKLRKRKAKKTSKNKAKRIRLDDLSSESTAVLLDDSDDDDDDSGDEDDSSVEIVADPKKSQSNPTKEALDTETKNSFPPNDTKQEAKALSAESAMEEDYFGEDGYFKPEPMWAPRSTVNEVIPPPKEESPAPDSAPVPSSVETAPSPTPKKLETASTNEVAPAASSTEPTITIVDDGALENDLTEDEEPDELGSNWWKEIGADVTESTEPLSARDLLRLSNKMIIVLSLLARTVLEGEKMIIFSQSLYTLDVIEKFLSLRKWGELVGNNFENDAHRFSMWSKGEEYLRIDGSISNRQSLIDKFNDPVKGARTHLMLISTKAGNMGINLQAANRLVLFDCSWNPMHDLQAIYRAYRVGQHRDVFIYRLVSSGTMEEKIYKKQVSKMARANRVVDAQMPSNAFTEKEKSELLEFDEEESPDLDDNDDMVDGNAPAPTKRSNALQQLMDALQEGTQDKVLMQFLEEYGTSLFKSIENHDSFLVDDSEQHLNSEEKESAELELQRELDSLRGVVRPSASSFVTAAAAPSQLPPPPPPPPAVVKPTTVAPAVTRVTKAVVNTRPAAPAQPLIGAPRPNTPNREFTDQQMQILVATVSLLPADTYFERVSMSMNVLFGYRNGVNAISADEYRKLFQRMNQQGKVSEYVTNPNFQNFREQVRLAYLRRGITL